MSPDDVFERARQIAEVRADQAAGRDSIAAGLVAAREIEGWVHAQVAGLTAQLSKVESFPEKTIAETSKSGLGRAGRTKERSETLGSTPSLAGALADGQITAGHVDAVTRGKKKLDADQVAEFLDRADALSDVAAAATVGEFSRRMDFEVRRMQRDDGEDRLVRQKKATRLSTWTDGDGMFNLRGIFDPELAVKLAARLDAALASLFSEEVPEHCPADNVEKNRFLAAHALARLVTGTASVRGGRPELIAVIEADAPEVTGPVVEWSIPVELPPSVIAALAAEADIHGVVVRNGVIVYAPGELNLGRRTRLANRDQRRALHALYRTCAIPGCDVRYDICKLHHVTWWRHGGRTDLDNLLPVCSRHHTKIHHDDWVVELGPRRQLTLRLPDGTIHNTGPPSRRAA